MAVAGGPARRDTPSTTGHAVPAAAPGTTISGRELPPVVTGPGREIEAPGEYPYTRGLHPQMYRTRLWTMRMFAGLRLARGHERSASATCWRRARPGLSTAFDMPALMGYDPDHPMSAGEVGREGVSAASADDLPRLFDGIDLGAVSTSMTISGPAPVALALFVAAAEERGFARPQPARHAPDGHPQGVHRPEGVDRPRAAGHAAGRRPDRVLHDRDAALAPGLGLRLPHPRGRGDGRPGARLHDRRRRRLRARSWWRAASTPTASCRGSRSSSTATSTSSRRSRSCAPPAACGRA